MRFPFLGLDVTAMHPSYASLILEPLKAERCPVTVRIYSDKWQRCLLDKPGLRVTPSTFQKSQMEPRSSSISEAVRKPLISNYLEEESVSGYGPFQGTVKTGTQSS